MRVASIAKLLERGESPTTQSNNNRRVHATVDHSQEIDLQGALDINSVGRRHRGSAAGDRQLRRPAAAVGFGAARAAVV